MNHHYYYDYYYDYDYYYHYCYSCYYYFSNNKLCPEHTSLVYTFFPLQNSKVSYFPKVIPLTAAIFVLYEFDYYTIWIEQFQRIIMLEKLDSHISEAINQLTSSKKQSNENAVLNLLLEKLEAIAINKEQLTERLKSGSHLPEKFFYFLQW